MQIIGNVWKYGDDINTDVIFAGKYVYTIYDPKEMAKHAMETLDPDFAAQVQAGDIVVGGKNFGCGSSREQAATCLKYSRLGAVVAKSFGRIFYRNGINEGLPLIVCPAAVDAVQNGESVRLDFEKGRLYCKAGLFRFNPLPEFVLEIMNDGGLIAHTKKKLKKIG